MAQMAWNNVEIEPIMNEADPSNNSPALQTDYKINGIQEAERTAYFNSRIVNSDSPSFANENWEIISGDHALQNHNNNDLAAEDVRESLEFHSPNLFLLRNVCSIRNTVCSLKDWVSPHCQ